MQKQKQTPQKNLDALSSTLAVVQLEERQFANLAGTLQKNLSNQDAKQKLQNYRQQSQNRQVLLQKIQHLMNKKLPNITTSPVESLHNELTQSAKTLKGEHPQDVLMLVIAHKAIGMLFTDYSYAANLAQFSSVSQKDQLTESLISAYQQLQHANDELSDIALSFLEGSQHQSQSVQTDHRPHQIYADYNPRSNQKTQSKQRQHANYKPDASENQGNTQGQQDDRNMKRNKKESGLLKKMKQGAKKVRQETQEALNSVEQSL